MGDREVGEKVRVRLLDRNFQKLPVLRVGDEDIGDVQKPKGFEQMLAVAERLAAEFPHVRVDLYNVEGRTWFGEMTFYNASGYMKYDPDSFDSKIGEKFRLEDYPK